MNIQSIEAARSILALNLTVPGPDEPVRKFVDLSRRIGGNRKSSRVFDDFCHLTYCVFAQRTTSDPKIHDDLQRQYDEVAAAYDPADLWAMAGMLGVAREAMSRGGDDFLGRVCGVMGALDGPTGQYFTPFDASRLFASLNPPDAAEAIQQCGHFTAMDPAAGSGGLLIAMADQIQSQGVNMNDVFFEGVELVPSTYHMLFVQLVLRGLAARAVCGNSLTQEVREFAYTPAALKFIRKHGPTAASTSMRLK